MRNVKEMGLFSIALAFVGLLATAPTATAAPLSIGKLIIPEPAPIVRPHVYSGPIYKGRLPKIIDPWREIERKSYMSANVSALAPMAYVKLCVSNPSVCKIGGAKMVTFDDNTRQTLSKINRTVNSAMKPRHDRGDIWTVGATEGDCEDYALTKRQKLIAAGLPPSALRMAVARTPRGEGHAVLVITTDVGDMVLDNRNNRIKSWENTDLTWIKIQSADNPMQWKTIQV